MNALKALQIHVKLKTLHTKNKRKNLAAKLSFATLLCCYSLHDVSGKDRSAPPIRAMSRAAEVSGEHIEKRKRYVSFHPDVTVYLQIP